MLSNIVFSHLIHAFDYEVQVKMYNHIVDLYKYLLKQPAHL